MRTDILAYLQQELYHRCSLPSNHFGMTCYDHIRSVVHRGQELAQEYGADVEVVMIAAWLHDIASVTDYSLYPQHHLHGAVLAGELLTQWAYPPEKIALVQSCIRSHRGSVQLEKPNLEALCVADADAISHFDHVCSLLHLAYVTKGMGVEEGRAYVREKLERSFRKLSERSKAFYGETCEKILHSGIV